MRLPLVPAQSLIVGFMILAIVYAVLYAFSGVPIHGGIVMFALIMAKLYDLDDKITRGGL